MDWWTTAIATARLVNADRLLWIVELPMRVQLVGPADQLVLSSSHVASVALDACRRRVSKRRRGYSTQAIKMRRRLVSRGFSSALPLTPKSWALLLRCDGGFFFFLTTTTLYLHSSDETCCDHGRTLRLPLRLHTFKLLRDHFLTSDRSYSPANMYSSGSSWW